MKNAALLSALAMLAACATPAAPQRWSGIYETQFETSSFSPEGGQERWWVSAADAAAAAQLRAAIAAPAEGPPWGRAAVTLEGVLSAPGRYGHLGAYERSLEVTRVISARPLRAPAPRT
ncbi:MAG: hypothetical protein AB7L65_07600 [Hyphomonadaceae bacterium]